MIAGIISSIATGLAGPLINKVGDAFIAYQNKEISKAELQAKVEQALIASASEVERSGDDAVTKTFESLQQTMRVSPGLTRAYMTVLYSQLFVLVWHQFGIPFYLHFIADAGTRYPSSGSTTEWAYLLVGALCGAAPILLRSGSGAGNFTERVKRMIGR